MKVVVTGHTSGLGKGFYDYFLCQGHEVLGLSRSNGYDISTDFEKIVKISTGCDLFINNAYCGDSQLKLLLLLKNKVKNMVVCGSIIRKYVNIVDNQYSRDKQKLFKICELISIKETELKLLHLDLSFIYNPDIINFDPARDYEIKIEEIIKFVDFWLENPKITQIQFCWKMTPYVYSKIQNICTNEFELENIKKRIDSIYEKY